MLSIIYSTNRICYESDSTERVNAIKEIEESKKYFKIPRLIFFRVSLINLNHANDKRES